ncbi:MAG: hypothetical protein LWY06_05090 [Firmicutes bacterium]|nr:hypothetical protein [Bacillota bacterium]
MKPDIISSAEQIVTNRRLKNDVGGILEKCQDDIQDVILIFVTTAWEVDAYWTSLPSKSVLRVLGALDKGIRGAGEINPSHEQEAFQ